MISRAKIRPETKPESQNNTLSKNVGAGVYGPSSPCWMYLECFMVFAFITGKGKVQSGVISLFFASLDITALK